jgi:hypothetical protein
MQKKQIIIIVFMAMLALPSCFQNFICIHGNGRIVNNYRTPGSFNKLTNSTGIDVIFRVSDTTGISIEAEENLLDYIETEINNNTLEIGTRRGTNCLDFTEPARIIVTTPALSEFVQSGSGDFLGDALSGSFVSVRSSGSGDISIDAITGNDLEMRTSGSGDMQIKAINCSSIDAKISGSGDINVKGNATNASFQTTGSGNYYAQGLLLKTADITISGSGNIYTSIENRLNARISGSGNIYLKGNPSISENISGSGRIIMYKSENN